MTRDGSPVPPDDPGRYEPTLDALPDLAWLAGPDGAAEYVNARCREFFGVPLDDLLGWDWGWVVHPSDLHRTLTAWGASVRTGGPFQVEYRLRRANGEYRWFAGRARPVRDRGGHVLRWVGTCTEIDDRKHAEDALREARCLVRALVERGEQGFALLGADRVARYASPAVARILGFAPEEFIGADVWDWAHPDDRAGLSGWLGYLLANPGERLGVSARFRDRSGSYRRLTVRGTSLLPDPDVRAVAVSFWEAADPPPTSSSPGGGA
jgi:PAS domain S-box-containing protein